MASKIKVDELETADGTGTIALQNQISGMTTASLPTGSVLQVVSGHLSAGFTTTSGSYVDTGLTATITPSATSSKIYVTVQSNFSNGEGYVGMINLMRDSTILGAGDAYSSADRVAVGGRGMHANESEKYSINYLDSPSTTSATVYKIQIKTESSDPIMVNYSHANYGGASNGYRVGSNIILMEIAG